MVFAIAFFLTFGWQASEPTSAMCVAPIGNAAAHELCLGEAAANHAKAAGESPDRRRAFETAAEHYLRAADIGTSGLRLIALSALVVIYNRGALDEPNAREVTLRELMKLVPDDPQYPLKLAEHQEQHQFFEAAEATLLEARHQYSANIDIYRRLAQFYARRVTHLTTTARQAMPADPPNPGGPDRNGVYEVGGHLPPPRREGVAVYPEDAKAAGIRGAVQTEIVIDEAGAVVDARVLKSVPLLDDAALAAVREWRFAPTLVNGKPVPVKMTVVVTFTP